MKLIPQHSLSILEVILLMPLYIKCVVTIFQTSHSILIMGVFFQKECTMVIYQYLRLTKHINLRLLEKRLKFHLRQFY